MQTQHRVCVFYDGKSLPWKHVMVPFTAAVDPSQRELNEFTAAARQAVQSSVQAGVVPRHACFSCGSPSVGVVVKTGFQRIDGVLKAMPYGGMRCASEVCREHISNRLTEFLEMAVRDGKGKVIDLGVKKGCYQCAQEDACIDLAFNGERVCYGCRKSICHHCGSTTKTASCCSGCSVMAYCGPECQKAAWPKHKLECNKTKEFGIAHRK